MKKLITKSNLRFWGLCFLSPILLSICFGSNILIGKWEAYRTTVNFETECTSSGCTAHPEWKNTFVPTNSSVSNNPVPIIKNSLNPALCFVISGTGSKLIESTRISIQFGNTISDLELNFAEPKKNCFSTPQSQLYGIRINETLHKPEAHEEYAKILNSHFLKKELGLNDELLSAFSFELVGTYKLSYFQLALAYIVSFMLSYKAIEVLGKARHYIKTGKHSH